jgi:hypothetical protein
MRNRSCRNVHTYICTSIHDCVAGVYVYVYVFVCVCIVIAVIIFDSNDSVPIDATNVIVIIIVVEEWIDMRHDGVVIVIIDCSRNRTRNEVIATFTGVIVIVDVDVVGG